MRQLLIPAALCAAAGCATITEGTSQTLTFQVAPAEARCTVERSGEGVLAEFGSGTHELKVKKDKDELVVACRSPGYKDASVKIAAAASPAAVTGALLLDFGIVDLATGAFWTYPDKHDIVLEKL